MRCVLLVFLLLFFYGCFPANYAYYEPVSAEGEAYSSFPGVTFGKDTLEFSFNDSRIRIQGSSTGFYLVVYVDKKDLLRFISNKLEWYLKSSKNSNEKVEYHLAYYDSKAKRIQQNPDDTMGIGIYENFVKLSDVEQDKYVVKLPSVDINSNIFEIPAIEFTKKEGFGVFPING